MQKIVYIILLMSFLTAFLYSDFKILTAAKNSPVPASPAVENIPSVKAAAERTTRAGAAGEEKTAAPASENFFGAKNTGEAEIEVVGTLRMVGSARSTEMVVTPDGGRDHYLEGEKSEIERLFPYQGRKVRARGVPVKEENNYPDARYNFTKNILIVRQIEFIQ